jgi:hypothetical protein
VAQLVDELHKSRKVVGSNPYLFTNIFHLINPAGRPMALGLTQLTEVPGLFRCVKGGQCLGLKILQNFCAICLKFEILKFLYSSGPLQACNGIALLFQINFYYT